MKTKTTRDYMKALERLLPALTELSDKAHRVTEEISDDDNGIDRTFSLGEIAELLGATCPANAKILADIATFLVSHSHRDDEVESTSTSPDNVTEH